MLTTLYRALDAFKYTPVHPQWVANSWHLKKIDLIKKHVQQGVCLDIGSGNDSIERYNATKKSFFESMVVSLASSKLNKIFEYWSLSPEKVAEHESYTVKF